ncbi:hypothetical protein F5Y11DRAFT_319055 [Daldinia sp. FL1419]|nr:hypothetical protein F5Y11DRAFT_319055 [Daldinia sp. FL1419]
MLFFTNRPLIPSRAFSRFSICICLVPVSNLSPFFLPHFIRVSTTLLRLTLTMQSVSLRTPGWFSSGEAVTLAQAASRAGVTDVVLNFTEFDFSKAFNFIKERLSPEFIEKYWLVSVADASRGCYTSSRKVSICWFSVKFLDVLWCLLFSRTAGPSPWYHLLDGLDVAKTNGTADGMIDVVALNRNIFNRPADAETIMHDELDEFFPMKISMPEDITLTPLMEHRKRVAATDLSGPRIKIKRSPSSHE